MKRKSITIIISSILTISLIIFGLAIHYKRYTIPLYNHYFHKYNYQLPEIGGDFVVNIEPPEHHEDLPKAHLNVLKAAFPEYNIVYDNNRKPHLIAQTLDNMPALLEANKNPRWDAPYFTFTGERTVIKPSWYRRSGIPILEFTTVTPQTDRQIYWPYMIWNKVGGAPERKYTQNDRKKFLAYISTNCQPIREELFAKIKEVEPSAEALGKCSNPSGKRIRGGDWSHLEDIYKDYTFAFAMENYDAPGYITEKLLLTLRGGTIPIYWGDADDTLGNILNFNPKAYINVKNFTNLDEVVKFLMDLNNDPEKIARMRAEPIFKNSKVPDIFYVSGNDLNNPEIQRVAKIMRTNYLEEIRRNS